MSYFPIENAFVFIRVSLLSCSGYDTYGLCPTCRRSEFRESYSKYEGAISLSSLCPRCFPGGGFGGGLQGGWGAAVETGVESAWIFFGRFACTRSPDICHGKSMAEFMPGGPPLFGRGFHALILYGLIILLLFVCGTLASKNPTLGVGCNYSSMRHCTCAWLKHTTTRTLSCARILWLS